jgi:hypothetical protein
MVRGVVAFLASISLSQGLSSTHHHILHAHQESEPGAAPEKNFIVLRLAHTGSSWITSLIGAQNDTYITREAIWPLNPHRSEIFKWATELSSHNVTQYLERVLRHPSGSFLDPDAVQIFDGEQFDTKEGEGGASPSLLATKSHSARTNPGVIECLQKFGRNCSVKYLGMTLDPTGSSLRDHLDLVFRSLEHRHPGIPIIVYRRSNVVKRAMAHGGMRYVLRSKTKLDLSEFLLAVKQSIDADKALFHAATYFRNVKLVNYEALQRDPKGVMQGVFNFIGIPGAVTDEMLDNGADITPEDLREYLENFDELREELEKRVPCLTKQMLSPNVEEFPISCDVTHALHTYVQGIAA